MDWLASILPVTVISAIALFMIKEIVESLRRWRSNRRKGLALRTLLARECELNHWTHKTLKETLTLIQQDLKEGIAGEYVIKRLHSGEELFRSQSTDMIWHQSPLPAVRADLMSKIMLDVAILDKSLFSYLQAAYDSVMLTKHVRDSLIMFIESDDEFHQHFFKSFPDYGLAELDEVLDDLDNLYKEYTGKELKVSRVR